VNVFKTLEEEEYSKMEKFVIVCGLVLVGLVLIVAFGALLALPTMWLVNGLFAPAALEAVFGGPISFLGAWGLNILAGLLFKSSGTTVKKD